MSTETVKQVIGQAVVDPDFRELLFSDSEKALEAYDLTEEERAALAEIKREAFDEVAGELEERISRAGITFGAPGDPLKPDQMRDLNEALQEVGLYGGWGPGEVGLYGA